MADRRSSNRRSGSRGTGSGSNRRRTTSSSRRSSSSSGTNPTPFIIGGAVVVVAILGFVVFGNSSSGDESRRDDDIQAEDVRSPSNGSGVGTGRSSSKPKITNALSKKTDGTPYQGRNAKVDRSKYRESMKKVDRSPWDKIVSIMGDATALRRQANAAQKAGDQEKYVKLARQAFRRWREGDQMSEEWELEIEFLQEGMWDDMFQKESKKLARWLKMFRGWLKYEND